MKDLEERLSKSVVKMEWEESERGWGVRPDGCSLHLCIEDCRQFVKEYWAKMPREVPDEYSRPAGEPYSVLVSEELYKEIEKSGKGIWGFNYEASGLKFSEHLQEYR